MADMIDLRIQHHFSTGVYAKQMHLPAGHYADTHKHQYDHLSVLASGTAVVEVEGQHKTYTGPCCIEIKAGLMHKITALTDVSWFCIHGTDATDADGIDEVLIEKEA